MSFLPHTADERRQMVEAIGVESVEDLFVNIPGDLRSGPPAIPAGLSEMEVLRLMDGLAGQNLDLDHRSSFLGGGAYRHYIPSAVGAITGRSEFYTSYTPYQAEISQGTLQVIYEYQTMIAEMMALDVSNASLYDAATACVEASNIAMSQTHRERLIVSSCVHPEHRAVLRTYLSAQGFEVVEVGGDWVTEPGELAAALDESVAGVLVQSPNFYGALEPMAELAQCAHESGALFIGVHNPLSLALLAPPGQYGADIAVGCGQPFGIPLMYGGPYLGLIAVRAGLERRLPGRIAGATIDSQGRKGYVLTLQAREQHIRREKATSNICTNHALMALAATVHLSLLGPEGIRETANLCLQKAHYAGDVLAAVPGFARAYDAPFFNEFVLRTPVPAGEVNRYLLGRDIVGGIDLGRFDERLQDCLLLACTEMTSRQDIDDLAATLAELQPGQGVPERVEREPAPTGAGGCA
jgi:glycine dehydrogenase subunit 1